MDKEIIILGDVEMGGGTLTDDFISDRAISELINELTEKRHPIDLVLNGDTFDFLKCPFIDDKTKTCSYPRHIHKDISLSKLKLIHKAHKKVFEALSKFVKKKNNKLIFIFGNHDADLLFKAVQKEIKIILKSRKNVLFRWFYKSNGVYAEHGQQYDFLNKMNKKIPFHEYRGKQILNVPWISYSVMNRFMYIKEEHPFTERIKPIPLLFTYHRAVAKKISIRLIIYFLKSILYYPIRYYSDPTYMFPKDMVFEIYRRAKDFNWEIESIVDKFKHRKKRTLKKNRVNVLGHIHDRYVEEKKGRVLIHTGSWRDEYLLDKKTRILTLEPKRYVQIYIEGDVFNWNLREHPIERRKYNFGDVKKNELKYIKKAAEAEKFKIQIIFEG